MAVARADGRWTGRRPVTGDRVHPPLPVSLVLPGRHSWPGDGRDGGGRAEGRRAAGRGRCRRGRPGGCGRVGRPGHVRRPGRGRSRGRRGRARPVRIGRCPRPGRAAPRSPPGSTVTASWMLRPSSLDSALVISERSLVSSCSLTNSFGVAISAVFSTSPSGRVSCSQARWAGSMCISASSSRDLAHTSARSASLIGRSPRARPHM